MLKRRLWVLGGFALIAQLAASEARADNWFDFGFLWPHRGRAYYADPYYMPAQPRANLYGNPGGAPFDDSYYDPTIGGPQDGPPPVPRKPVKHKVAKAKPAPATPATAATAAPSKTPDTQGAQTVGEVDPPKAKQPTAADTGATTTASTSKLAAGAITCDKAQQVVAGYGFSDVKPATCGGKIYAFNAVRDGKPYAIKVNAANGELTEVKKAQP